MRIRSIAKRLERGERCRVLGFSQGPGLPAASKEPSVLLAKEVLRREREARPALRALIQGETLSTHARRHRNVAWHNKDIPPAGAPEAAWSAAQSGARLGFSHPPAVSSEPKVVYKYIVIEVPPTHAAGIWTPSSIAKDAPHVEVEGSTKQVKGEEAPSVASVEEDQHLQALLNRSKSHQALFDQLALRSQRLEGAIAALHTLAGELNLDRAEQLSRKSFEKPSVELPKGSKFDVIAQYAKETHGSPISIPMAASLLIEQARGNDQRGLIPPANICTNRFGRCYRLPDTSSLSAPLKRALKSDGNLVFDEGVALLALEAPSLSTGASTRVPHGGIFASAVEVASTARSAATREPISTGLSISEKRASPGPWAPSFKKGTQ